MSRTKERTKLKYNSSLYSNLIVACMASEYKEPEPLMEPKMLMKYYKNGEGDSIINKDALNIGQHIDIDPSVESQEMVRRHQQTFVMRWNTAVSNYKLSDFEIDMDSFYNDDFYYDWSIWDYQKVHVGDRFYMLKVGEGDVGIVMSGIIVSMPYKDEDWSGKGRDVRYVRMMPDCMIHPGKSPLVSIQALDEAMPGVNWNEGHSGVLLTDLQTKKFNELWQQNLNRLD